MESLITYYQQLPFYLDPMALKLGPFSVSWYSVMYLVAFFVVYNLLSYRLRRGEGEFTGDLLQHFLLYSFIGLIVGARLGYALFYNFSYYWENPLTIISPFNPVTGEFTGIYGMSYHGGLIGVIIFSLFFIKKYNLNFWALAEFVVPAIPAGYFFGRLGNFINGELYGRVTSQPWGMRFPSDPYVFLRHPSQLYEALGEGAILFFLLWPLRNNKQFEGKLLITYLAGYSIARFLIEFFREPDERLGLVWGILTMGQILSLGMALSSAVIYCLRRKYLVR